MIATILCIYLSSIPITTGMLSKSKGQILRVAATLHVLFHRENPVTLSEEAVKAAENFVEVCVQHAAYLAGRGAIEEAIQAMHPGL